MQGSFFFRDPLSRPVPAVRFKNGEKTFRLTSSSTNEASVIGAPSVSVANATYSTSGVVDTLRQTQVVIRQLPPPPAPVFITNVFQTINVNLSLIHISEPTRLV